MNCTDMPDEELLAAVSAARGKAHRAPFAEWSKDHRGHSAIIHHTNAWAVESGELVRLCHELTKRGLAMPNCDCPAGAHDWERPTLSGGE